MVWHKLTKKSEMNFITKELKVSSDLFSAASVDTDEQINNTSNLTNACTHMFPCDGTNIIDIFDLSLVLDHPHSNRILTNLWS